jgi:sec-independent protein translocase protein TatC
LAFEFPLLAYVLAAMGILPAELLRRNWRIAIILLTVLAAAITPTIDPINMLLVLVPLILLYFISVGTASLAQRQRAARRDRNV